MKVAFFFPASRWWLGYGTSLPETQGIPAARTKEALERKGIEVLHLDLWEREQDFDLLHIFGAGYEIEKFIKMAKWRGIPVVVTANDFSAKPLWKWYLARTIDPLIPISTMYRMRQTIYDIVDRIICSSRSEALQLSKRFRINTSKVRIVPHGVDKELFANANPELFIKHFGISDFVLQVARINRAKGQVRLIHALEGTGLDVVFIGSLVPVGETVNPEEQQEFLRLVKKLPWVHYVGELKNDDPLLASAYAAAKVHVLPSQWEILGMVTLEACAAGTAAISGRYPPIYEYLGDRILYCDPMDINSIRKSVLKAYEEGPKPGVREYVLSNFSWDHIANLLIDIYQEVLHEKQS
ncbi:glycosyltransferase family 4 protein [Thermodesulforhabdus norvegica]|uniref:Glycosyltransferase involved in cell wall bisynthesis n=1 Tax=Thermodesulforhabdus norvegica TaxID=39841 RepID=A0A1I4TUR0_9BACT|nr:glycosyltransferase family 4 protein [Thermodesulforhabdus norvegica]SFM80536.1 Glycosyltransferase involved in cell wall bisynthesis [Thermodesulforhabdus norvegica]